MKEKLKAHWKEILIVIFVLFSLSKCTQSCNRQTKLDVANKYIVTLDSTISVLKADTLAKAHQIEVLEEKINTANERANVAVAKEETAKANEETAKANEETARARAAQAKAEAEKLKAQQSKKDEH